MGAVRDDSGRRMSENVERLGWVDLRHKNERR